MLPVKTLWPINFLRLRLSAVVLTKMPWKTKFLMWTQSCLSLKMTSKRNSLISLSSCKNKWMRMARATKCSKNKALDRKWLSSIFLRSIQAWTWWDTPMGLHWLKAFHHTGWPSSARKLVSTSLVKSLKATLTREQIATCRRTSHLSTRQSKRIQPWTRERLVNSQKSSRTRSSSCKLWAISTPIKSIRPQKTS